MKMTGENEKIKGNYDDEWTDKFMKWLRSSGLL